MDTGYLILNLNAEKLNFLKYLLIILNLTFIFCTGIILGNLLLSLIFRFSSFLRGWSDYRRFSIELMNSSGGKPFFGIFLSLFPLLVINFILFQFYHNTDFKIFPYLSVEILLLVISFIFLYLFVMLSKKNMEDDLKVALPGLISLFLLLIAIYFYSLSFSLLLDPEKWLFTQNPLRTILTWNGFTRFLYTVFLMTSIYIGWLMYGCKRNRFNYEFLKTSTPVFLISTLILLPLLLLWNAILIPYQSITQSNLIIFLVVFLLLATVAFSGLKILEIGNFASADRIILTLLIVLSLLSINDLIAREQARKGQVLSLSRLMEKVKVKEEVKADKTMPSKGEEVFTTVCSGCHSFEARVVGPAFKDVLPKYKSAEDLKAFIKNPVKKNPDFPQMPPLGLSDDEINAVAEYLMKRAKE